MTKIYILTQGCSANVADSEIMAGILDKEGYELVESSNNADLVIINSCTVKNATESSFYKLLESFKVPVIVAGCIAQSDPEKLPHYSLIGTQQIHNVVKVVEETLNGNIIQLTKPSNDVRLLYPKVRKNPVVEIIPINIGCIGFCTYCKTKAARGALKSFPKEDIIRQARLSIQQGVKEIWITSQDTGAYGLDIYEKRYLPELLKELCEINGEFFIRLGMTNPNHIWKIVDELIEVYKNPKMFKFLHLPVQSGDDKVLEDMKREYTVSQYKIIVSKFREAFPDITIATDIICGFPTETDEAHKNTIKTLMETVPEVINISKYSARPKTVAARMEQLPESVKKDRSKEVTELLHNIASEYGELWQNWVGEVFVDDIGKDNTMVAKNYAYKHIIVPGKYNLGDKLKVKIIETKTFYLIAEVLDIIETNKKLPKKLVVIN